MKLPERFQFRIDEYPGHTHSAKILDENYVKIKWARGWHVVCSNADLWDVCTVEEAQGWIDEGDWVVVDEKRSEEGALPDEFYFEACRGKYLMKLVDGLYRCYDHNQVVGAGAAWSITDIKENVKSGIWKIIDNKPLTAEQKRANKEFRERIVALQSSIKLNQQDIEHKNRLIANYEDQIKQLEEKIVEGE